MKKNLRKTFSKIMTLTLIASLTLGGVPNVAKAQEVDKLLNMPLTVEAKEKILNDYGSYLSKLDKTFEEKVNQEEVIRVIVEVEGKSAQEMSTDGKTITEQAKISIEDAQKPIVDAVSNIEGVEVRHSYTNVFNGFSAEVKREDISKIEEIPGVKKVTEVQRYIENINNAKKLTQIEDVWQKYSLKGEGMVVAVVDTGIDYKHEDFSSPQDTSKLKLNKEKIEGIKKSGVLNANRNSQTYFSDKVPFGYNYADKNNDIVDTRDAKAPHGAHVSGIIGANGDDSKISDNKAVKGVAPNVQLLAMKVFSNGKNGQYTYADDQLAAIDDAVALGADVINMSLGAPSGFRNDSDPVEDAITRATNAGVMVVVSAGNSGYSTEPYGLGSLNDQITASNPALAKDALMVASYENSTIIDKVINFKDKSGNVIAEGAFKEHQVDIEGIYNKDKEIAGGGLGKPEELENVRGKVALIKRGEIGFTDKIKNAQSKGAIGVIIYNGDNDETLINMATDDSIKIPAIFVSNSVGTKILNYLKSNPIYFNGETKLGSSENPSSSQYSEFTSWGPSPSLEFKPQVAAPGGQIYSTLNQGQHGVMSGTSMSAPHVSGSMALLIQAIKGYAPELQGRELIEYAKNIMMNTSAIKIDKNTNIPYSPRRQGAGLVQLEDAVRNKVIVTSNGKAGAELKEIDGKEKKFTLNIHNYGDEEVEYELESIGGVLTQDISNEHGKMIKDISLSKDDASISFDKNSIKVPAKQEKTIEVTLNVGDNVSKDRYLEGFIKLNSKKNNMPSLTMPYIGFYGEWDNESMMTNNAWDESKHPFVEAVKDSGEYPKVLVENLALSTTRRLGKESLNILGVTGQNPDKTNIYNGSKISISPNGDRVNDIIFPAIYLMRNAKTVTAEVLDSKGTVVRSVGSAKDFRKNMIAIEQGKIPTLMKDLAWDGKIFKSSTGRYTTAPNGQYTYRLKMKIDFEDAKEQIVDIPVKVDTSSPWFSFEKCEKLDDGNVKVYFKAGDDESGIREDAKFPIMINGQLNMKDTESETNYDEKTGLYSKVLTGLDKDKENEIIIGGFDYANNLGGTTMKINVE